MSQIPTSFEIVGRFNFFEGQNILSLTKIIERITTIHSTKFIYYENIFNEESNSNYLVP
jgi:ArsR family metal-binding transcriptional regulator